MKNDRLFFELMGRETQLPQSTSARLAQVYDQLHLVPQKRKEQNMQKDNYKKEKRRFVLTLAAAAVMVLCAGSVLAYTIAHYDFVNAVWRGGSTETQSLAVEDYITKADISVTVQGYTYTIEEYMLDENGMGFLRWSVENPKGLPVMNDATNGGQYTGGDSEGWFEPDAEGLIVGDVWYCFPDDEEEIPNIHTWVDGEISTDTKMYFTDVFTFTDTMSGDTIVVNLGMRDSEWNTVGETVELSVKKKMPAVEFGDSTGGVRAELSALGMMICGPDFYNGYDIDRLVICGADGDYAVTDDAKGICAWRTATIGMDGSKRVIFDRMVEPYDVESITVNGYVLTRELAEEVPFDPSAAPKPELAESAPSADRSGLVLASSPEENPFHYRRADGIEVFVITNDTIAAASEEDVHDYVAFCHEYLTYDEFLANVREGYDEFYSSRQHYLESYPASPADGQVDGGQVIDIYLEIYNALMKKTASENTEEVEYIVAELRGDVWCVRTNTDIFWDAAFDVSTGELLDPRIDFDKLYE